MIVALSSLEPDTSAGRILVVVLGAAILVVNLAVVRRLYPGPFFRGFLVAVGVFLSFDIVVDHWLFRLHRITDGSEADILEPILVLLGLGFVAFGMRGEMAERSASPRGVEPEAGAAPAYEGRGGQSHES